MKGRGKPEEMLVGKGTIIWRSALVRTSLAYPAFSSPLPSHIYVTYLHILDNPNPIFRYAKWKKWRWNLFYWMGGGRDRRAEHHLLFFSS